MDETTTFDVIDENDVVNCDAEILDDDSNESETSGIGTVIGLVGTGIAAGIAIHKWVAPAVGKGFRAIKSGIHNLTADKKNYIEVGEKEEDSKDSDN